MKNVNSAIVMMLSGISIDLVSAGCYDPVNGAPWQDRGNAHWHVERACRGYDGNRGAFQGTFTPRETKYACVQGTGTQYYEFSVQNLNYGESFDLDDNHCVERLGNEIWGCTSGGESSIAGWHFRSDPNHGTC